MNKVLAAGIGFVVLVWLATTSAAPAIVAILVVAILYQFGHSQGKQAAS